LRHREFLDCLVPALVGTVGNALLEKIELMQFEENLSVPDLASD
jgi:hypothetical protein